MLSRIPTMFGLAFIAVASLALTGCTNGNNREGIDSLPHVSAPVSINESFSISALKAGEEQPGNDGELLVQERVGLHYRISIARTSLEKEFLLQGSMTSQPIAAMSKGIKSRVVAFRERAGVLYLLEATQGHSVTSDLPQNLILTSFPVIESTASRITFDFNAGMKNLFVYGDWHAEDFSGTGYDAKGTFTAARVSESYIEKAKITDKNQVMIRQVAQLRSQTSDAMMLVEAKYYLSPYRPDPTYAPVRSTHDFDNFGFFNAAPLLMKSGTTAVHVTRFHPAKPIVFAISANTPADYKQAVRDGILYWNKVFGKDVVQAVEGPEGVTAPDIDYNVVQWVPFDYAGMAYADAQMDPRSGEILHAQVYMTSAFTFGGKLQARQLLRRLAAAPKPSTQQFGLQGFSHKGFCDYEMNEHVTQGIESLLSSGADDAMVLKASQDYVREVVAHEIGHTLGLRHNFAGSLATNYPLAKRDEIIASYYAKKQAPDNVISSSSVMEYTQFFDAALSGDQMSRGVAAYDYDKKAIATLYYGTKFKAEELPLFCTDSHAMTLTTDCVRFDLGASIVEASIYGVNQSLKHLPYAVIERYISSRLVDEGEVAKPVEKIPLPDPNATAASLLASRSGVLKQLTNKGALLKVMRMFPIVGDFNDEIVRRELVNYMASEIHRAGGMDVVFSPVPSGLADTLIAQLNDILAKPEYQQGGSPEQTFAFSPAEIAIIKANAATYFRKLEAAIVKADIQTFAPPKPTTPEEAVAMAKSMPKFVDDSLTDKLLQIIGQRMRNVILAVTGNKILAEIEIPAPDSTEKDPKTVVRTVQLPKYVHPYEVRSMAATLLKGERSEALEWGITERLAIQEELKKSLDASLTISIDKVKAEKFPKPVFRWVLENKKVLSSF
jgi:hypothetical protein